MVVGGATVSGGEALDAEHSSLSVPVTTGITIVATETTRDASVDLFTPPDACA